MIQKISKIFFCISMVSLLVPIILNAQSNVDTSKLVYKTDEEIHKELIELSIKKSIVSFSNQIIDFGVQETITNMHPIRSKIGKKEGLKIDDLFRVTENVYESKTNKTIQKTVGYVRVKRVAKNDYNADGTYKASAFYKTPSLHIRKGMKLTEIHKGDFTLGLSYNTNSNSLIGGVFANMEYITHWFPGLRVGLDVGFNPALSSNNFTDFSHNNGSFTGQSITGAISFKEHINFNYLSITPLFGFYYTHASLTSGTGDYDPSNIGSDFYSGLTAVDLGLLYGADLGLNLNKTLQIHLGIRKNSGIAVLKNDDGGLSIPIDFDNSSFSFGLRFLNF